MNKLIGYHGTTPENAKLILEQKYFKPSTRIDEWLGYGIYFFVHKSWAKNWISIKYNSTRNSAVLKVLLLYSDEQLVDLDDPDEMECLDKMMKSLFDTVPCVDYLDYTKKTSQQKMCLVCNMLKDLYTNIGIIMYTFSVPKKGSYIPYKQNQKQVCVNDSSIIKNIELCREKSEYNVGF